MDTTTTTPADGTPEWHALRRSGVGGSDVEKILGLSRWATPAEVYRRKLGIDPPGQSSAAAERGTALEPLVLERAALHLAPSRRIEDAPKFVRHPRWEEGVRLLANPDALALADGEPTQIVEAKTTLIGGWTWRQGRPLDRWILQVHHYAACLGVAGAYLACLGGPGDDPGRWTEDSTELRVWWISVDPRLSAAIEAAAADFWRHVEAMEPPPPRLPAADEVYDLLSCASYHLI